MKIMKAIHKSAFLLGALALAACNEEVDNAYSRHNFVVEINSSAQTVVLDEDAADETALTVEWTPAAEYGDDYIVTYYYQIEVDGSKSEAVTEYEDTGNFRREYTNADLQGMLVNHFGALTSSYCDVRFTITVSFDGPTLIIPDEASVSVRVKTYGPKQFEADELYMSGSAFETPVQIAASASNPRLFVWTGTLKQGTVYFPVVYGDENNVIVPASGADTEIVETPMEAQVLGADETHGGWKIPADDEYRVTVNLDAKTVTIIPTSSIVEIDKIYLAGTAAPEAEIEVAQTLENASVYAFRGELNAGTLYLPLLYDEKTEMSFVPAEGDDIHDGEASAYMQVATSSVAPNNRYWTIPADGTYRIVVDLDAKTITFRSAATDLKNTVVSFNKTYTEDGTDKANPYEMEVTQLWMYGTFNGYDRDPDHSGYFVGINEAYSLKQSLANPNVFVYKGAVLPRKTAEDGNNKGSGAPSKSQTATVNFKVTPWNYNVYSYGSTADAVQNQYSGYTEASLGKVEELVAGQSHNRYAYFIIPEGCNYVEIDIENLTVVFDNRE